MSRFKIYETPRGYELKEVREVWVGEFAKRDHAEMFMELFEAAAEEDGEVTEKVSAALSVDADESKPHPERIERQITEEERLAIIRASKAEMNPAPDPQHNAHEAPAQANEDPVDGKPHYGIGKYLQTMQPLTEFSEVLAVREEVDIVTKLAKETSNADDLTKLSARYEGLKKRGKEIFESKREDARDYLAATIDVAGMRDVADIEEEMGVVSHYSGLFAPRSPERLQLDALKKQMHAKRERLLAEKPAPAMQPATPPPSWKKPAPQQAKPKDTAELQTTQLKAILDSISLREGVSENALYAFANQAVPMSTPQFVDLLKNLEKAGEIIVIKKLPNNSNRIFRKSAPPTDREPMSDLEERVYDKLLVDFMENEDKRVSVVPVDDLSKAFKGGDKRDCVKALENLHTKGWVCQLHSSPSRRVIHILPE
jgi:hypothetical protein